MMRHVLLVVDFGRASGFARVGEALAAQFAAAGWRVSVLALQYGGDPHPLQQAYALYPAHLGGDGLGYGRVAPLAGSIGPDVVLIINDAWVCAPYLASLAPLRQAGAGPAVVLYVPVDGTDVDPGDVQPLNAADAVVAYTAFGLEELRRAGLHTPAEVIPHGVDTAVFFPRDRRQVRARLGLDPDWFIVLLLDRYTTRKRLDLAVQGFAQFAERVDEPTKLWFHGSPVDEQGDIRHLARCFGVQDHLVLTEHLDRALDGISDEHLAEVYSACDVRLSTSMGEGWGLPTMEGMACGLPQIVTRWAALGEWPEPYVLALAPDHRQMHVNGSTVGAVVHPTAVAGALLELAHDPDERGRMAQRGRAHVARPRFSWPVIGAQFIAVCEAALSARELHRAHQTAAPLSA